MASDVFGDRRAIIRRRRRLRLARTIVVATTIGIAIFLWLRPEGSTPSPIPSQSPLPAVAACGAEVPEEAQPKRYRAPPQMQLEPGIDYRAVIRTSCGDLKLDLLEDRAPSAVNNFVFLAREGFYNGLIWHQVEYDFIIQSGDPNGVNGLAPDGPGYAIEDGPPAASGDYVFGTVGFATTAAGRGVGSQFFIVVHDLKGALTGKPEPLEIEPSYTIFGAVGPKFYGSLENIARQPVVGGGDPIESVRPTVSIFIESITIVEKSGSKS